MKSVAFKGKNSVRIEDINEWKHHNSYQLLDVTCDLMLVFNPIETFRRYLMDLKIFVD